MRREPSLVERVLADRGPGRDSPVSPVRAAAPVRPAIEPVTDAGVTPIAELIEREIDRALAATGQHNSRAAKLLGISRATLYRRLSLRAAK